MEEDIYKFTFGKRARVLRDQEPFDSDQRPHFGMILFGYHAALEEVRKRLGDRENWSLEEIELFLNELENEAK
jgi:hypothetical protein